MLGSFVCAQGSDAVVCRLRSEGLEDGAAKMRGDIYCGADVNAKSQRWKAELDRLWYWILMMFVVPTYALLKETVGEVTQKCENKAKSLSFLSLKNSHLGKYFRVLKLLKKER